MTLGWYERPGAHTEIAELISWLLDRCELTGLDEALCVIEKPWKYSAEREQMVAERGRVRAG